MATSNFQLQSAIDGFIERLNSKGGFTSEDLNELKAHLADSVSELRLKGFSPEESFLVASCRIGNENELSTEYQKVNGTINVRPQLFFLITGMLLFFLLFQIWGLFRSLSQFIALSIDSNYEGSFFISLFFSFLLIGGYFLILNSAKPIASMEKKFFRKQDNFSVIYVAGALLLTLLIIYLDGILALNNYSLFKSRHKGQIIFDDPYSKVSIWIVPVGFLLLTIFFLFKRENEKFSFGKLANSTGLIFFMSTGIIWEIIAALTRFITGGMNMLSGALIYAIVFSIGIFVLAKYIDQKPLKKIIAFSAFAIIIEFTAVFLNPLLSMGAILSVFFYFLIGIGAIAYLSGRFIYKNSMSVH
jgi:hypothetical protein